MKRFRSIFLSVATVTIFYSSWSNAGNLGAISNHQVTQKAALKNVLELNVGMFKLYDQALEDFQKGFLSNHPLILGLFSGDGGKMILYRPGKEAEQAPSVPVIYQILKSTGHSTMAISQIALQYLNKNNAIGWREHFENYLVQNNKALNGLDEVAMNSSWREVVARILKANSDYLSLSLSKNQLSSEDLHAFTKKTVPDLKLIIGWAAQTQVNHWMGVLDKWKAALGEDWDKTYAASNTIYVARQNNILFSVLAQYFGPQAINERLLLIETVSFTTTPTDLLTSISRILSDRITGEAFFGNKWVMDFELMGGDARKAIISEMQKRGQEAFLPPLVPFGSKQWPALVTPGPGAKTLDDLK
jgi:hypothetical protein